MSSQLFDNASSIEMGPTTEPCGPEDRCRPSLCSSAAISLTSANRAGYSRNALNYWYERKWTDLTALSTTAVSDRAALACRLATPPPHSARRCPAQQNLPKRCRLFRIAASP